MVKNAWKNPWLESMQVPNFIIHQSKLELTMPFLTLHNWSRSGQSQTVYMPHGFCGADDSIAHSFPVAGENNHNCLIQLQPLQHGNNPSVVGKKIREEFREHFSLEGAVNWQREYCTNQN